MLGVEVIEPGVEPRHAPTPIELGFHGLPGERRHVQPRSARLLVEVVGQTDVPPSHTQRIHTWGRLVGTWPMTRRDTTTTPTRGGIDRGTPTGQPGMSDDARVFVDISTTEGRA